MKNFKVTVFDLKTLSWWNANRNKIDMDPPYQRRGRLWSDTDKAYLIDSILNGFDIPKLYIADFTWKDSKLNEKRLPYAIIDGKQRLEAIFDFFESKITLNDDFEYLDNPKIKLGGLSYKDLIENHKEISEDFDNYSLTIMSVITDEEEPIKELFVRLNRSKALTGAEIRNAMAGRAPEVIRQISKHEFFKTNIKFTTKRGQDLNAAAKLLLFEYSKEMKETKRSNLDRFVRETASEKNKEKLELAGRYVIDTLDNMSEIFLPKDKLLTSAGIIPVLYWFIRRIPEDTYSLVRKFFSLFEIMRKEQRRRIKDFPNTNDIVQKLVEYDSFNRSTDDLSSHQGRYKILIDAFSKLIDIGYLFDVQIPNIAGKYSPIQRRVLHL